MRLIDSNHLVIDIAKDTDWFALCIELDNHSLLSGSWYITLFKLGIVVEWKLG
jgi:hypothetical protein